MKCKDQKKKPKNYFFHPFEIAFCGFSNSGKTTLIANLLKHFSQFNIGYAKHDGSHKFDIDHPGKDTYLAHQSGASAIWIEDSSHSAQINYLETNKFDRCNQLLESDFVFVEGFKGSHIPKFFFVGKEDIQEYKNIIALVGEENSPPNTSLDVPYFCRNDIEQIGKFIENYLQRQISSIPLYGLVLIGGHSTRMGHDKAHLNYHGTSQVEHCYKLLQPHCQKVFVSCRQEQEVGRGLETLHDRFLGFGPMGGILSALTRWPEAAWLVLACDLPHVEEKTIAALLEKRNPFKIATAFTSTKDSFPEPLCAVYEPKSKARLLQFLGQGYSCPRKVMLNSQVQLLTQTNPHWLENINSPQEHKQALAVLKEEI